MELVRVPQLTRSVPYAYAAVSSDGYVFTAGSCPLDGDGAVVPGGVAEQAAAVMANLSIVLDASGCSIRDVLKSTVYVASADRADLVAAWDVVRASFGDHDAPSTLLGVAVLGYPGQLVEVEAVAQRPRR
jgi:enamine deaminase RidA (YjgF/YER057c/UK114 family)